MVKSTITLQNGTIITVEGEPTDVKEVLGHYDERFDEKRERIAIKSQKRLSSQEVKPSSEAADKGGKDFVVDIVNAIKNSEEIDQIESKILDKASQVDRVVLPLYIVSRYFNNGFHLSSNDIYKVLKELGISMALPNISKTLRSSALKYVIAEKATKKGESTPYKISLKGRKYMEDVLAK